MKINSSSERVTLDTIKNVTTEGKSLANVTEVIFDRDYIEKYRHDWCWLAPQTIPSEIGWFNIDRENYRLEKINSEEAKTIEWQDRLYVYGSALIAATEKTPLALYIGDEYDDGRLSALYLCGPDYSTWAALK